VEDARNLDRIRRDLIDNDGWKSVDRKTRRGQGRSERASLPFLPAHRIATAVEAGDDSERFISINYEHQRVWKPA
jgi:hypothetical protein